MQHFVKSLPGWANPRHPQGVLNGQLTLNSLMLGGLVVCQPYPWLALGVMAVLLALTCVLHGRARVGLLLLYGLMGWAGEISLGLLGGIWQHQAPVACGVVCGGWQGVPFFMAPTWALMGALMLALQGVLRPVKP